MATGSDGTAASSLASSLFYLDLSRNALTGSIPLGIVQDLPNMQVIDIAENLLTGQVPFVAMQEHWTELERLDLHQNSMLQGTLPATSRNGVALHFTNFNLDTVIGSEWTKLKVLDIRETQITGMIPDEYCELNVATREMAFTCSKALCGCDCPC